MLLANILRSTIAKQLPDTAGFLGLFDHFELEPGQYSISKWEHAHGGHVRVWFSAPQQGGGKIWYIHRDDFECESNLNEIRLTVPYYSRRNSEGSQWHKHSNSVAHAMLLSFLNPAAILGDMEYVLRWVAPEGDGAAWDTHTRVLRKFKIESIYAEDLDYSHIERSLKLGYPVVVGNLHRGNHIAPIAENCLVITGFNKAAGKFYAHDPWGKPFAYDSAEGKDVSFDLYPVFERRWMEGASSGRGRLITAIDGTATGVI